MAVEAIEDARLQEAAEDGSDRDGRLEDAVALSELTFGVPAAQDVIKGGPVARLEEAYHEAKTEHGSVGFRSCESKSENGPPDFEERDPNYSSIVSFVLLRAAASSEGACIL